MGVGMPSCSADYAPRGGRRCGTTPGGGGDGRCICCPCVGGRQGRLRGGAKALVPGTCHRGCLPEGAYQKALWPPQTNVCPSTRGVIVTLHPSSSHSPPVASTRGQCTFTARVPDEDIRGLAAFVLERAEAGWAVEAAQ